MRFACDYAFHMPKMVQIRNMPESMHRTFKARAATAGMSLSDYLLSELRHSCERPTLEEMRDRLRHRRPLTRPVSAAQAVRREREAR